MKRKLLFLALGISGYINAQFQVQVLSITTNDLVYDSKTDRIYASIPSSNGANGNSIGIINPNTYTLEETVFMGSEPSEMAISDNGEFIYTGFSGSATVRRFDIATKKASISFPLGNDSFSGPFYAYDLSVMPGNSHAVAVSRITKNSSGFYGVAIYDDGVPRPTNSNTNFYIDDSYVINFKTPSLIYAFNNHSTGFNLNRLAVNSGGITGVSGTGSIVNSFSVNNFVINNNYLYFDYGAIVDITGSPFNSGQFTGADGRVMYDSLNDLVCFASYDTFGTGGNIVFKRYNPNTFLIKDSKIIDQTFGSTKHIISCGNGCYAFNTTDNNLVIINGPKLGITKVKPKSNFITISPNPVSDYLSIKNDTEIKEIKVSEINGREINNVDFSDNRIYLGNLPTGIYLVKITDMNGIITTEKIIKK